jgi:23S rRNA pseudouridine1911/1915/1917 synthase
VNAGWTYRERLPAEAASLSVLEWLARRHTHSSIGVWGDRLVAGEVDLEGRMARADDRLRTGQTLVWRRPPWDEPDVPLTFAVLFRDTHLLAVAKPRGLPTLPNGGFLEHTLLARLRRRWPEAVPLHRLGRGTSGLVLCARTAEARRALSHAWRVGRVEKEYRALVVGTPREAAFSVTTPIGLVPHTRLGQVHAARADGRPALSHVRLVASRDGTSIVAVSIPTGRAHQIRIHLAAAGHPLVGDPLYVAGGVPGEAPGLPGETGYWLHAGRLAFAHPATGGRIELECAPPPQLRAI